MLASSSPDYLQAEREFKSKNYSGALADIDRMLARNSSPADREFLLRQRDICLRSLGRPDGPAQAGPTRVAGVLTTDTSAVDCGPRALRLVLAQLGKQATVERLCSLAGTDGNGTSLSGLEKAATAYGLRAEGVQMDLNALKQWSGTGIAWVDGDHYVAVLAPNGDSTRIHDPNQPTEEEIPTEQLLRRSGGIVLQISRP